MNSSPGDQLDLLGRIEPVAEVRSGSTVLGTWMGQKAWLAFLNAEWLTPSDNGQVLLGVNCLVREHEVVSEQGVAVWFDLALLPRVTVRAYADGKWSTSDISELREAHCAVAWNGPLPLFAVKRFGVATEDERRHILALTRSFRDVEPPTQPIEVEGAKALTAVEPNEHPALTGTMHPPGNWNAFRGAAAMAAWAVPAIDPWLDLLCQSLQGHAPGAAADVVHAKWWRTPLWTCHSNTVSDDPLWTAIINELGTVQGTKNLRPRESLENICVRAKSLGTDAERVDRLRTSTQHLLDDQTTIQRGGVIDDVLGLSLQLLLLRPTADRFASWREDWPAMPPGAWWTGATLCGFLTGFRNLPREFRGTAEARRQLALRTWKLGCGGDTGLWDTVSNEKLVWVRVGDAISLRSAGKEWAEHKISRRGRWYQLDYAVDAVRLAAEKLVGESQPELLTTRVVLKEGRLPLFGNGSARVEKKNLALIVKDQLEFELGSTATIEKRFAGDRFKDWLATASIADPLPRPVFTEETAAAPKEPAALDLPGIEKVETPVAKPKRKSRPSAKKTVAVSADPPSGFELRLDFISEDEERELLATIDAEKWDSRMARRVQHYGWRYDYKARKVDRKAYLGPLPDWLNLLAIRLKDAGVFTELPDQVIVNNYEGSQSISKHVDCVPCFRGPVVTISLNEAWEMVFARENAAEDAPKFGQVLPRRSAAILDGEARVDWNHEIPKRKNEASGPRGRRVSVTFRKVAV